MATSRRKKPGRSTSKKPAKKTDVKKTARKRGDISGVITRREPVLTKIPQRVFSIDVEIERGDGDEQVEPGALYQLDARGRPIEKLAVVRDGTLKIDPRWAKSIERVALGPDTGSDTEIEDIEREQLMTFHLAKTLPEWQARRALHIPRNVWTRWLSRLVCLSGRARACTWWLAPLGTPSLAPVISPAPDSLGLQPAPSSILRPWPFRSRCYPVCDGVVEVYERTCCCPAWRVLDPRLAELLEKLEKLVAVRWPPIPDPDPGPLLTELTTMVGPRPQPDPAPLVRRERKHAAARGQLPAEPPSEKLQQDYHALIELPRAQADAYIMDRPYLAHLLCTCKVRKVGEALLQPGGEFHFCYRKYLLLRPTWQRCHTTYGFKVRQYQEGVWRTIYDGVGKSELFRVDDDIVLASYNPLARACDEDEWDIEHDGEFVVLDKIGTTDSAELVSPTQTALSGIDVSLPAHGGLVFPPPPGAASGMNNNRPWGGALSFRLQITPGLEGVVKYYRISVVPCDDSGNPTGDPRVLIDPVSWQYFTYESGAYKVESQHLGPHVVGSQEGLFEVPYPGFNKHWRSAQYHQRWNTAIETAESGGSGRYLVVVEVFDAAGQRLYPSGGAHESSDVPAGFDFLRLRKGADPDTVGYSQLHHCFWADNRECVADIQNLYKPDGSKSSQSCLFLSGESTSQFAVHFAAGHYGGPAGETFMRNYVLRYKKGMHGSWRSLENGSQDQPTPFSMAGVKSNTTTYEDMLEGSPKCTFSLELWSHARHWNGFGRIHGYDDRDVVSFALDKQSS